MSIDVGGIMQGIDGVQGRIQSMMNETDLKDPENMLKVQQEIAQYQQLFGIVSAIYSDIKQTAQGIIQKM